jgi:mono/diheme cytochrome c family protein
MKNRVLTVILWCIAGMAAVFSWSQCTHEYIENINPVCFESDVLPIFQSNCTQSGCHNSSDRESGYDLSNYNGITREGIEAGNYRKSEMYKVLVQYTGESAMPPKPYQRLSDAQIATIALWIEQGAENTINCAQNTCDTTAVSFSVAVKPILSNYCTGCHSGSAPSGGIDYSTYASTKTTALNGQMTGSIEHKSGFKAMPQGSNKLSDCQISTIKKWIALGAKND